jgi:hypothetical protein
MFKKKSDGFVHQLNCLSPLVCLSVSVTSNCTRGENVRRVQEYLHPFSEHLIDWFHITMRLTVLQ